MRPIDADVLRTSIEKDRDASDMPKMWYEGIEYAINHIIHAPTADAVEVKHGKWTKVGDHAYRCSVCNDISCCMGDYCPDCGAKMRKETGDGRNN